MDTRSFSVVCCLALFCTFLGANCLSDKERELLSIVNSAVKNSLEQDNQYSRATVEQEGVTTGEDTTVSLSYNIEVVGYAQKNEKRGEWDRYWRSVIQHESVVYPKEGESETVSSEIISEIAVIDGQYWVKENPESDWTLFENSILADVFDTEKLEESMDSQKAAILPEERVGGVTDLGVKLVENSKVRCLNVTVDSFSGMLSGLFNAGDQQRVDTLQDITDSVTDALVAVYEYCISESDNLLVRMDGRGQVPNYSVEVEGEELSGTIDQTSTAVYKFDEVVDVRKLAGIEKALDSVNLMKAGSGLYALSLLVAFASGIASLLF